MTSSTRFPLILACFFLSGFAALLYETAWTQQFAFVFGTSELAVATVLAGYMGGLAVGAAVAGRLAPRLRRPVLAYGLLELGIAAAALAVPIAIRGSTWLFVSLFGGQDTIPEAGHTVAATFYLACSFAILLVPTALMGATLPLLARHAVVREEEIGSRVGLLYAVNTIGAVAGTLMAAFVLLPNLGLGDTVRMGVAVNAAVFACAALVARGLPSLPKIAEKVGALVRPLSHRASLVLPLIALSGVTSFTYEVLWTRLLGHILGGSTFAFATMLASFLVGIAVGSAVASRLATTAARSAAGFCVAQLGIAVLSVAAFAGVNALPELAQSLGATAKPQLLIDTLLSAGVLLPAALCMGATFPFAVRILARNEAEAGPAVARVFSWNTVGAIIGSIGSGFYLIPGLGYAGALATAATLNVVLATAALFLVPPVRRPLGLAVAACAIALMLVRPATPWKILRSSPIGAPGPAGGAIEYYGIGRTATVLLIDGRIGWMLRANGLPEASIQRKGGRSNGSPTAGFLGALPTLARPDSRSMLVIGLGGGIALEWVPPTLEHIDVIELEPHVVAANRSVGSGRLLDPLSDPRLRLTINDARGALVLTDKRYDAVVSQPSHPWTAGASHLYTREFFSLVRDHLSENGVFVQWIGLDFVDESLLRTLVATLVDVFASVRLYRPVPGSVLFLCSDAPLAMDETVPRAVADAPDFFHMLGVWGPEDLAAALAVDEAGARSFAEGADLNTDNHNLLASRSPRILGSALRASGANRILSPLYPVPSPDADFDSTYLVRRLLRRGARESPENVAHAMEDPGARETALGLIAFARGELDGARAHFERALRIDPEAVPPRVALLRMQPGGAAGGELDDGLPETVTAVIEGLRFEAKGDWASVRALEPKLARLTPHDPMFSDAARLRAEWRLESGSVELAREGLDTWDRMLVFRSRPADLVLRARLAVAADYPGAALTNLASVASGMSNPSRPELRQALAVLRELPASPELAPRRDRVRRQVMMRLRDKFSGR